MVDSGAPSLSEVREKGYPLRTPDEDIDMVEEVRKHGVDPAEVSMIIYTHLHWDHAWNTNSFPNATLIAQAAEMAAAINPMKIGRKSYGFMEESNGPRVAALDYALSGCKWRCGNTSRYSSHNDTRAYHRKPVCTGGY